MDIVLTDLLNIERLQQFQDSFANILNISLLTIDHKGDPITKVSNSPTVSSSAEAIFLSQITWSSKEETYLAASSTSSTIFSIPLIVEHQKLGYIIGSQQNVTLPLEQLNALKNTLQVSAAILCELACKNYKQKCRNIELERATELKSHFLANMSHEIRTPMNAIIGMAEMSLREELPNNARGYISQIKSSGKVLLTIINDILDFTKIESGKLEISNVEYEVLSLVNDIISTINTRIGDKDIKLIVDVDPNIPHKLYGDDIRIKQVMVNLANNAVKFTQHGYVILTLNGERINNKFNLKISVKDTGIGIKEEDMYKLFGLFQQLDSKRNRNIEGTGLGLKISKELVNLMKGEITVKSTYGEGSEFSFNVPQVIVRDTPCGFLAQDADSYKIASLISDTHVENSLCKLMTQLGVPYTACHSFEEVLNYPDVTHLFVGQSSYKGEVKAYMEQLPPNVGVVLTRNRSLDITPNLKELKAPLYCLNVLNILNNASIINTEAADLDMLNFQAPDARILIVDDNAINITVAMGLLDPLNMFCDKALSGDEAIEKIKQHTYDIIFMDHMMPGKDGVETTHEIRALPIPYCSTVPIIALTANALRGAREMFIDEGMNDFVAKPIELRDIVNKLRRWLPSDKIIKSTHSMNTENAEVDKVPRIAGLDTEFGLSLAGNINIYQRVLIDYYNAIDKKATEIAAYEASEDIKNYTIEVHALKSSSKLIGALELSFLAEKLENAGHTNDLAMIHTETEDLIKIYRGYSYLLRPYIDSLQKNKTSTKVTVSQDELSACLNELYHALEDFDIDTAEEKMELLKGYQLDEPFEKQLAKIDEAVIELDYEEGINLIKALL